MYSYWGCKNRAFYLLQKNKSHLIDSILLNAYRKQKSPGLYPGLWQEYDCKTIYFEVAILLNVYTKLLLLIIVLLLR